MIVKTQKITGKELEPGDLFSSVDAVYWDNIDQSSSLGERVYIRTNHPCPKGQEDEVIYKITIEK